MRLVLIRLIRYFLMRPAALVGVAAVVVLIGAGAVLAPGLLTLNGPSFPGLHLSLPGPTGEPSATAQYLQGNRDYNAQLMWASLSAVAQQRFTSQGGSVDELQRQMDAAKQSGVKLEDIAYVGGKALPDGTSMQFYVVGVMEPPSASLDYVPYLFTLDHAGKIIKVQ